MSPNFGESPIFDVFTGGTETAGSSAGLSAAGPGRLNESLEPPKSLPIKVTGDSYKECPL